jgi:hypothetical protein
MILPEGKRHVVLRWLQSYEEWRIANQREECREGNGWGAIPTGEVMALHQLAYDIYCLEVSRRMRRFLRNRLRNRGQFQGARYEVAIASILARAGFDVTLLDDTEKSKKHCEFIAEYRHTRENVAVEVKSRHRKGVLHEKGSFDPKEDIKGHVLHLLQKALDQKPKDLPYLIFIDINVPPTPELSLPQKTWFNDIKSIADKSIIPSRFNALIVTNFAYYYAGNKGPTPPAEFLFSRSLTILLWYLIDRGAISRANTYCATYYYYRHKFSKFPARARLKPCMEANGKLKPLRVLGLSATVLLIRN